MYPSSVVQLRGAVVEWTTSIVRGLVCLRDDLFVRSLDAFRVGWRQILAGLRAEVLCQVQPVPSACVQLVARLLQSGCSSVLHTAWFSRFPPSPPLDTL